MRVLTNAQERRLHMIEEDQPETQVVGWIGTSSAGGPVIRFRGGHRYITTAGTLMACPGPQKAGVNYG